MGVSERYTVKDGCMVFLIKSNKNEPICVTYWSLAKNIHTKWKVNFQGGRIGKFALFIYRGLAFRPKASLGLTVTWRRRNNTCKINKNIPQLHLFKQYLKNTFDVDKYNATLTMSYDKIAAEWLHYKKLIQI